MKSVKAKAAALFALSVILVAALFYILTITRVRLSLDEETAVQERAKRDALYWQLRATSSDNVLRTSQDEIFFLYPNNSIRSSPSSNIDERYLSEIRGEEGLVKTSTFLWSYRRLPEGEYVVLVTPKHEAYALLYELQLEFVIVTTVLTIMMAGLGFISADMLEHR